MPSTIARTSEYPKELSLHGPAPFVPQEKVLVDLPNRFIEPQNGIYVVKSAEEEAAIKRALRNRVYDADPASMGVSAEPCPACGWVTPSTVARLRHTSCHPTRTA